MFYDKIMNHANYTDYSNSYDGSKARVGSSYWSGALDHL